MNALQVLNEIWDEAQNRSIHEAIFTVPATPLSAVEDLPLRLPNSEVYSLSSPRPLHMRAFLPRARTTVLLLSAAVVTGCGSTAPTTATTTTPTTTATPVTSSATLQPSQTSRHYRDLYHRELD